MLNMPRSSVYTSAPRGAAVRGSQSSSGTTSMPTPTSGEIRQLRETLSGRGSREAVSGIVTSQDNS